MHGLRYLRLLNEWSYHPLPILWLHGVYGSNFTVYSTLHLLRLQSASPCLQYVTPISIIYNVSPLYINSMPSCSGLCSIFFVWLYCLRFISHKKLPKFLNLWYLSKLVSVLPCTLKLKHLWSLSTESFNVFRLILRIICVCTPKQHYTICESRTTFYTLHEEFTPSKSYVNHR